MVYLRAEFFLPAVLLDLSAADIQKRPDDHEARPVRSLIWDACKAVGPCPSYDPEQHRLCIVIGVMSQRYGDLIPFYTPVSQRCSDAGKCIIPGFAPCFFRCHLQTCRHLAAVRFKGETWHIRLLTQIFYICLVLISRHGPETVVDMYGVKMYARVFCDLFEHIKKAYRIGASRKPDNDMGIFCEHPMFLYGLRYFFFQFL